MIRLSPIVAAAMTASLLSPTVTLAARADTLEEVRNRGYVRCAIGNRPVGDTRIGLSGYEGFFPEFCRVVALALFNDRDAVQLEPMLIRHGLQSISEGAVDIYVSNVTWTFSRDIVLGLTPAAVLYFDGQGFLSRRGDVDGPLSTLDHATVCVSRSTTTIANLEDFIALHGLSWDLLAFESSEGRNDAFFSRRCDLLTTDRLVLASLRATGTEDPGNYVLHPEIISEEPLVAYVNDDDMVWANLVRWAIYATLVAEELGIASDTIELSLTSSNPAIRRFLGLEDMPGSEVLGLSPQWARNVIAGAGNYGEIFERYLGSGSEIGVERGDNALVGEGGLMFSPPFR